MPYADELASSGGESDAHPVLFALEALPGLSARPVHKLVREILRLHLRKEKGEKHQMEGGSWWSLEQTRDDGEGSTAGTRESKRDDARDGRKADPDVNGGSRLSRAWLQENWDYVTRTR